MNDRDKDNLYFKDQARLAFGFLGDSGFTDAFETEDTLTWEHNQIKFFISYERLSYEITATLVVDAHQLNVSAFVVTLLNCQHLENTRILPQSRVKA